MKRTVILSTVLFMALFLLGMVYIYQNKSREYVPQKKIETVISNVKDTNQKPPEPSENPPWDKTIKTNTTNVIPTDNIKILGKGIILSGISQRLSKLLENTSQLNGKDYFSGDLKIFEINENTSEDGKLSSSMSLAISGFEYTDGNEEIKLPEIKLEINGTGTANDLVDKAAIELYGEILKKINKRAPNALKTGFE